MIPVKKRKCINDCCSIKYVKYKWNEEWYSNCKNSSEKVKPRTRVGMIIFDPIKRKILLIQSCGYLWGLPKGRLENGENILTGAIRELKEETGIILKNEDVNSHPMFLKKDSYYFYYEMSKCDVDVQTHEGNDANAVTWIGLDCLRTFENSSGCLMITKHCRQVLYKLFNIKTQSRMQY
jgi:ADP-ribose pyrophosphatase YjhB (NUDIX family)